MSERRHDTWIIAHRNETLDKTPIAVRLSHISAIQQDMFGQTAIFIGGIRPCVDIPFTEFLSIIEQFDTLEDQREPTS